LDPPYLPAFYGFANNPEAREENFKEIFERLREG
jgi:hypothetical protein